MLHCSRLIGFGPCPISPMAYSRDRKNTRAMLIRAPNYYCTVTPSVRKMVCLTLLAAHFLVGLEALFFIFIVNVHMIIQSGFFYKYFCTEFVASFLSINSLILWFSFFHGFIMCFLRVSSDLTICLIIRPFDSFTANLKNG